MSKETELFEKLTEKMTSEFSKIKDNDVKQAVESAFSVYKEQYDLKNGEEVKAINKKLSKINESLTDLDSDQTKELSKQLTKLESDFSAFEDRLKKIGENQSKLAMGAGRNGNATALDSKLEEYLLNQLPHENGKVIYEAFEGRALASADNFKGALELDAKSMLAANDPMTNANSTSGDAVSKDMNTMGFKHIPPILNDHIADIFSTPNMEPKDGMVLRISHSLENGVGIKTEGTGSFIKSSVQLKSQRFQTFTYGTTATISMEQNEDVPAIMEELKSVVPELLMDDLDSKIMTTGGDNSATPWGAFSTNVTHPNCTIFNPYLYAGSNPDANFADLLGKMKLFVRSQNSRVNGVIAHDNFYDNSEGLRDANDNSLMDRRVQYNSGGEIVGVSGLAVRRSRKMDEFALFVTSTPSEILAIRKTVSMITGLGAGDWEKNNISFKWYGRFAYGCKDPEANIYSADYLADLEILKMSAATALAYTDDVAKGTGGFDQANITISLLKTAGAINLIDANETAYQVAIAAETAIADLPALQAVINAVNP